MQFRVTDT
jgi:ribosomal protein S1